MIDYGSIIHSLSTSNKRKLQRIANCCMRFYTRHVEGTQSYLYVENKYLQSTPRQQWLLLILFYKAVVKGWAPGYIIDKSRQANIHSHLTRNRPYLFITLFLDCQPITFRQLTCGIYCQPEFFWVSAEVFRGRLRQHYSV